MKRHPLMVVMFVALMAVGLLVAQPLPVRANMMTFNSATEGLLFSPPSTYIEDGIKMTAVTGHYDIGYPNTNGDGGTRYVNIDGISTSTIKFEMADGSKFSLDSVWIKDYEEVFGANDYNWGFFNFSNGTNFRLVSGGSTSFSGSDSENLDWVTFSIGSVDGWNKNFAGLDTFTVTPVPLPSTLLLLGSGLVGLVGIGRKRFKK